MLTAACRNSSICDKSDCLSYTSGSNETISIGLGHDDLGQQDFGAILEHLSEGGAKCVGSADASGWGLSVSADSLWLDTERRMFLSGDPTHRDLQAMEGGYINACHLLYDGHTLWESYRVGLTSSGIPSTSCQNSFDRSFLALVCGAADAVANGDDLLFVGPLQSDHEIQWGIIPDAPTFASGVDDGISFTSHLWFRRHGTWVASFDNLPKLLSRLNKHTHRGDSEFVTQSSTPEEVVAGHRFVLRHSSFATALYLQILQELNWKAVPAEDHGLM